MKMINKLLYFALAITFLSSCDQEADVPTPKSGEADFSVFVSLGDSYSAGYTDGALSRDGQESAFTTLMAANLSGLGNEGFSVPFLPAETSVGSSLEGKMELQVTQSGLAPVTTEGNPELLTDPSTWINDGAPYHNVGIPGARSYHLVAPQYGDYTLGAGNFNPFYARFATAPGVSTALSDALSLNPTFFSLWIGGNDVLGYALAGGEGESAGMGGDDITPAGVFGQSYDLMLSSLTGQGAKGVIATVPDIDRIPFFNTVLPGMLELTAEQAAALNAGYQQYNDAEVQYNLEKITFTEGANYFVVEDEDHPLGMRQIETDEKILLTARTNITAAGWGSQSPVPQEYVLDKAELTAISEATEAFNGVIRDRAGQFDLALVETNDLLGATAEGLMVNGISYNNAYITGGVFSLDGIHVTARGSAILANEFIDAVNEKYGSTIPHVVVNNQDGIIFP
ncbi:GDSL-like Lipase/Acylhydrolase [Marinilabilia salmonicolor]|jgi:hypothetical protein|uniref:hypothetical protein n=1 Tax=Marinilabilia salmonicolor TaxID=989 RepID=UPI000D4A41BF|nr:hypothetical protein [Marinilabilia salmonicolor]PRY99974.1 GDSL-like Lipase/Acylhydrolase [Marinilabilia salmonicolor]